jgi:hypothetical protein
MAETLNMREASVKEITNFIKDLFNMEIYDPVIILGKMGMGKTASLKELAKELGIGYCELRLVNMTETDMLGIPTISSTGTTTYASNDLLPIETRDGERGILALDEITSCSAVMRAAAYQLLDGQRALGNYKLPEKWICVGLGNGPDDGGVFNGAEAALFTRCYGFRVALSLEAWKSWALKNNINPSVTAYLSYAPDKLHVYNPDELDGLCPTPRTWEKLSKLLNAKEKYNNGEPVPTDVAEFLASASIGTKEAGFFSGFYEYNLKKEVLNVTDILDGKADGRKVGANEPQIVYIAIESMVKKLNEEIESSKSKTGKVSGEVMKRLGNAVNWLIAASNTKLDYGVMGLRDLASGIDSFIELTCTNEFDEMCPEFLKFSIDNGNVVS